MRVQIEIQNMGAFQQMLTQWGTTKRKEIVKGLQECGLVVQSEARNLIIKGPKTGRLYTKKRRIKHRASAPGEAPASDTGTLVRSIIMKVDPIALTAIVGSDVKYAAALEHGTSKMAARPYLRRALANKRTQIIQIMRARLAR